MTELNTESVCEEIVLGQKNALWNRLYTALKEIYLEKKNSQTFLQGGKVPIWGLRVSKGSGQKLVIFRNYS